MPEMKKLSKKHFFIIRLALLFIILSGLLFFYFGRSIWVPVKNRLFGKKTESTVISQILKQRPEVAALLPETSQKLTIVVLKKERLVELWADGKFIKNYPMTAFSGKLGPKREEGDFQIPEGIYHPVYLNPNSSYYLSIKLDYPNEFDREMGKKDKRQYLGDDIFIHGKAVSIGCIAIGDRAIEEVFYLISRAGMKNTEFIISPYDMRKGRRHELEKNHPSWVADLYDNIAGKLTGM